MAEYTSDFNSIYYQKRFHQHELCWNIFKESVGLLKMSKVVFCFLMQSLGSQLEFLLAKMHTNRLSVIEDIKDEDRQWELRVEDEEEDFLDDGAEMVTVS